MSYTGYLLRILLLVATHLSVWLSGVYFAIHSTDDVVAMCSRIVVPLNAAVMVFAVICSVLWYFTKP